MVLNKRVREADNRIFRELNKGTCNTAIMSEESMLMGFSGGSNVWDCAQQDADAVTSFEAIADPPTHGFTATAVSGESCFVFKRG